MYISRYFVFLYLLQEAKYYIKSYKEYIGTSISSLVFLVIFYVFFVSILLLLLLLYQ